MKYGLIDLFKLCFYMVLSKFFFGLKVRIIKCYPTLINKSHIRFGSGFTAGKGFRCEALSKSSIIDFGVNVKINDYVHIGANNQILIGNNVLIGSRVTIVDHDHGSYSDLDACSPDCPPDNRKLKSMPIFIGDNCWIGEGVVILKGVNLPPGTIVGSNAVVTKSPKRTSIIGGNPCVELKYFDSKRKKWTKK